MAIYVHNTLTRARERFEPADPKHVTMYVCGPTVYNFAHIGNARPPVVFDVLARLLRRSYQLTYARNVTDVDDKINEAARAEGVPIGEVTDRYLKSFHDDLRALGVVPPDVEPRVTDNIPQIVRLIEKLIAAGHAYAAEGHVLFDVPSYERYGKLSGRDPEDMIAGARVEVAPYKRNPADFVLWKPSAPEIVGWDSPWGRGRPGWHIECSAMSERHLGETIDIHGGGVDLVFPHHENETAQSTCAHGGKLYARYWIHNGLVTVDGEKMSKSLGNVRLVRDLVDQGSEDVKRYRGQVIRFALLSAHYRQPLNWTNQLVIETEQKLDRLYRALQDEVKGEIDAAPLAPPPAGVLAALEDDLNTPQAIAELFSVMHAVHRATGDERRVLAESLRAGGWLLGVLHSDPEAWSKRPRDALVSLQGVEANSEVGQVLADGASPRERVVIEGAGSVGAQNATVQGRGDVTNAEIDSLLAQRDALRRERKFQEADRIRQQLTERGIVIEDVAGGARWRRVR